jgi:hypothetical protein
MSLIDFLESLLISTPDHAQVFGEPLMCGRIVGIECKGLPEFCLATGKIPIVRRLYTGKNGVRMGQSGIQAKSFAGGDAELAHKVPESGKGRSFACFGRSAFCFISA